MRAATTALLVMLLCATAWTQASASDFPRRRHHSQAVENEDGAAVARADRPILARGRVQAGRVTAPINEAVTVVLGESNRPQSSASDSGMPPPPPLSSDDNGGSSMPPPPPSSGDDGGFYLDAEPEQTPVPAGQDPPPPPAEEPPPVHQSPFIDPNNPEATVWGNATHDGVDREDPFCKWHDGMKFCA